MGESVKMSVTLEVLLMQVKAVGESASLALQCSKHLLHQSANKWTVNLEAVLDTLNDTEKMIKSAAENDANCMALHNLPLEVMYDIENMAKADLNDDGYYDGQDDDSGLLYQDEIKSSVKIKSQEMIKMEEEVGSVPDDLSYIVKTEIEPQDKPLDDEDYFYDDEFDQLDDSYEPEVKKERLSGKKKRKKKKFTGEYADVKSFPSRQPHPCDICGKVLGDRKTYKYHMNIHKGVKPHTCQVCGYSFRSKISFAHHMLNHEGVKKPICCDHCGKTFWFRSQLERHLTKHIPNKKPADKNFPCEICGKALSSQVSLTDHLRNHGDEKPFSCEKCGDSFKNYKAFNRHKVKNCNRHTCEVCGETFAGKHAFNKHKNSHLKVEKREYSCELCGKEFNFKSGLDYHMKKHDGNYQFSCESCGKAFVTKGALNYHKKIHEEKEYVTCEICAKSVTDLKKHMMVHEKSHVCKICQKSFAQRHSLVSHMLMHEDKRDFPCETCGKSFTTKKILKEHVNIHTGVKPYSCNICGKDFTQSSSLGRHLQSHKAKE
eukprot:TRINITY_DN6452_c0_g1_i4.p1 TRINITY_DN6452_c0_g1~~TRINITY_DN6452_c0_g1_i4.p1  ORF type:complete len:544 (-),score=81.76 TRINITY_DN6452_c0_g1_i4:304-1935(-)